MNTIYGCTAKDIRTMATKNPEKPKRMMTLLESLKIFWNIRTTTGAKVAPKNFTA